MDLTHVHLFYDFQQEVQRYPQRFQNAIDKKASVNLAGMVLSGREPLVLHRIIRRSTRMVSGCQPTREYIFNESQAGVHTFLLVLLGLLSCACPCPHDDFSGDVLPKSIPGLHLEKKGEPGVHKLS